MQWANEPATYEASDDGLELQVPGGTDCWRHTRHEFVQHDAPFYYRPVRGDFTASVTVAGEYADQYDQAGLLIEESETRWLKCGVEYLDGRQQASVVVTREVSDWSVVQLADDPDAVAMRVERHGPAVEVFYARPGEENAMMRQSYLTEAETLRVGMTAAAPQGEGFRARLTGFDVVESGAD
ncbi:MAG: DUF1349 domain-containing protein [Haloarculaceae archaeon]